MLILVFCLSSSILIGRLFYLQIVKGEDYLQNYELSIRRTSTIQGTRGNIYDRNGKLIAGNKVSYSVTIEDNGTYNTTKERILSLSVRKKTSGRTASRRLSYMRILICRRDFILPIRSSACCIISSVSGTAMTAAAVGVSARTSAT